MNTLAAPVHILALRSSKGRIALTATVAASGMASLDATVVNVALPTIGDEFGTGVSGQQWVLTAYLLSLASLILLAGALGDRFGRRRIFLVGTVWFAGASLLCGLAPSIEVLVVARILQGVGGALLTPGSLAILQASFRPSDRAAAIGAWSGLGAVAGAIGPFVGGGLIDGPGWRWAFLVNVPVAAIVIACTGAAIPETRDVHASRTLDVTGAAIAVVALATSTWALTEAGRRGWTDQLVLIAGALCLASSLAFVWRILHASEPLVSPTLFHSRVFTVVNVVTALLYATLGVAFFLVAYELQVAAGWSALQASAALLPVTVLMLVFSAPSGALAQRIGPRIQLTAGPLLAAAGLFLLSRIGPDSARLADVLPGAVVFGLGLVTFVAPLTASVMAAAGPDHVGAASGVNNAVARAASLTALAVVPVVSGLSAATGPAELTRAFRLAMLIAVCGAVGAAVVASVGLGRGVRAVCGPQRVQCGVDGPALQPDQRLSMSS